MERVHSKRRINVNYTAKESEQSKLKNLPQAKIFLQSHSNFQLFAIGLKAFRSGSITILEITLVPN